MTKMKAPDGITQVYIDREVKVPKSGIIDVPGEFVEPLKGHGFVEHQETDQEREKREKAEVVAKAKELKDAKDKAEALIESVKKEMKALGDKLAPEIKENIGRVLEDFTEILKSDDADLINAAAHALNEAALPMHAEGKSG